MKRIYNGNFYHGKLFIAQISNVKYGCLQKCSIKLKYYYKIENQNSKTYKKNINPETKITH